MVADGDGGHDPLKLSFESKEPDGSPRLFVGMHRPELLRPSGYVLCVCGHVLQTHEQNFEHWNQGHFDVPLYRVYDQDDGEEADVEPTGERP